MINLVTLATRVTEVTIIVETLEKNTYVIVPAKEQGKMKLNDSYLSVTII